MIRSVTAFSGKKTLIIRQLKTYCNCNVNVVLRLPLNRLIVEKLKLDDQLMCINISFYIKDRFN
jgi:hypothetical protein